MKRLKDISGSKFNMLTVIQYAGNSDKNQALWLCTCDCGNTRTVLGAALRRGAVYSCGCTRKPLEDGHGFTGTSEHNIWRGMLSRCYSETNPQYHHYGGRGIQVCAQWKENFPQFLADMGPRPSDKHSIERENTNGNYEPSNCKWATQQEQCRNRRTNVHHTAHGLTMLLPEWSEYLGVAEITLRKRLERGWSPEQTFTSQKFQGNPIQR